MRQDAVQLPDGYLYRDSQVWGDLQRGGVIVQGLRASFPDLSSSDPAAYRDLELNLRMMLARIGEGERIQFVMHTGSDFSKELDCYEAQTQNSNAAELTKEVRGELAERYRGRMASETLIMNNVSIYLSAKIAKLETDSGKRIRGFNQVFEVVKRSFEHRAAYFGLLLRGYGGSVVPMDTMAQYRELLSFWSPAVSRLPAFEDLDWHRTIQDLCGHSEVGFRRAPDHGLVIDGYHVGIMAFRTMPRRTNQQTMGPFLNLCVPGLFVTVNAEPLSIETEIQHEESRYGKLMSNIDAKNPSLESEVGLTKHKERMSRLLSNETVPFKCQIVVVARARTAEQLEQKMEAVRACVAKTGAEPFRPMVPTTVLSFYHCASPGIGPWIRYRDLWHKIDDLPLANMLPVGSSPSGDLDRADWIAANDCNGLLGGTFFADDQALHLSMFGTTGSGKSALIQNIMIQGAIRFRRIFIIDNGLSYMATCRKLDPESRPLIITSRSGYRFNVFDTQGTPLSSSTLNSASSLVHLLVGKVSDEDADKLRHAVISEAIAEMFAAAYRKWRNDNPELHFDVCKEAAVLLKFQAARLDENAGFLDAWTAARESRRADPEALREFEDVDPDAALELDKNPDTESFVQSLAIAGWSRKLFPTLSKLHDRLNAAAEQGGKHKELLGTLATLLRPWLRGGNYGSLLDGPANFDLGSSEVSADDPLRVVHVELGQIAEYEPELLGIVGFLIACQIQSEITMMPRDIAKQIILEELTSFLSIPGGDRIVNNLYERGRKYTCQVISVCQQYSTILTGHPAVARAIIGNSSGMFLLRNQSRVELNEFSQFIRLPEAVKDKIQRFPMPKDLKGRPDCHSGFCYVQLTGVEPKFFIGKSVISPELEYLTSSSGKDFEQKKKELRNVAINYSNNGDRDRHPGNERLLDAQVAEQPNGR